jgi:hypothetical protein
MRDVVIVEQRRHLIPQRLRRHDKYTVRVGISR